MTVNAVPTVSIDTDNSCGAPTLTANMGAQTGPFTYTWTGPNGFSASTPSIMPTVPGQYSVTVTKNGCTSPAASGTLCYVFTP